VVTAARVALAVATILLVGIATYGAGRARRPAGAAGASPAAGPVRIADAPRIRVPKLGSGSLPSLATPAPTPSPTPSADTSPQLPEQGSVPEEPVVPPPYLDPGVPQPPGGPDGDQDDDWSSGN
jgi:hypothetical protein